MTTTKLFRLMLGIAAAGAMTATAPVAAQTCAGDCSGDGSVAIAELIIGVRIALGDAPAADCLTLDEDENGAVGINELLAAVRQSLQGCSAPVSPTGTATIGTPTPTGTPVPTPGDDANLVASARVATDPVLQLFEAQESVATAVIIAGRGRRAARDGSSNASGCQQLDCALAGTLEVCCSDPVFSQTFDRCAFEDEVGTASLSGQIVIHGDSSSLCSGVLPLGASFAVELNGFTYDHSFVDGSFTRTIQQFSESYEIAPGDCIESQPDVFGLGIRGAGQRVLDGTLQRFQGDGAGNITVDAQSHFVAFQVAVASTQESEVCRTTATLNGSMSAADFRGGTQFSTTFTDFHVVQFPGPSTLSLELDGTIGTDCLADVTLSTTDPLRIAPGDACFTGGRLLTQSANGTVAASYSASGRVDLDLGADGSSEHQFAACTDVPAEQCRASGAALCDACTERSDCHAGLGCGACFDDCSGDTKRCAPFDTFVTCTDGVF